MLSLGSKLQVPQCTSSHLLIVQSTQQSITYFTGAHLLTAGSIEVQSPTYLAWRATLPFVQAYTLNQQRSTPRPKQRSSAYCRLYQGPVTNLSSLEAYLVLSKPEP